MKSLTQPCLMCNEIFDYFRLKGRQTKIILNEKFDLQNNSPTIFVAGLLLMRLNLASDCRYTGDSLCFYDQRETTPRCVHNKSCAA